MEMKQTVTNTYSGVAKNKYGRVDTKFEVVADVDSGVVTLRLGSGKPMAWRVDFKGANTIASALFEAARDADPGYRPDEQG